MQTQSTPQQIAIDSRASFEQVTAEHTDVSTFGEIRHIFDVLPYVAAVLNEHRQIIYSNQALIDLLGMHTIDEVLGKRPGEALACIHSAETEGGCGTSESCHLCGTLQAIRHAQANQEHITKECRITAVRNGHTVALDFNITATPLRHKDANYTVVVLKDIADEKRRRALEQIFFHDIINHAQSVAGVLTCAQEVTNLEEINQLLDLAHMASMEMIDGILSQRDLLAAENGEIGVMKRTLGTQRILEDCVVMLKHHFAATDRRLVLDAESVDLPVETDESLLKRIVVNMIKNSLEATPLGGTVTAGCARKGDAVVFWSHNESAIPRDVQLQIFQRSFSTKGANRGLGTYSMKMLGERYLGGSVSFTTSESAGTKFFFELPIGKQPPQV
jgi:K+-sensing histidine kinase KdpD